MANNWSLPYRGLFWACMKIFWSEKSFCMANVYSIHAKCLRILIKLKVHKTCHMEFVAVLRRPGVAPLRPVLPRLRTEMWR